MAQEKDERLGMAAARRVGEATEDGPRKAHVSGRSGAREAGNGGNGGATPLEPARRREQYLIGERTPASAPFSANSQPMMDSVVEYLGRQDNVEVVGRIKLSGTRPFAGGADGTSEVVVARMDESKAERLRASAPPHLAIERDDFVSYVDYSSIPAHVAPWGTMLPLRSVSHELSIRVVGERDQPLARAAVVLYGAGLPAQGITDESGAARITFFGGPIEAIQALCVKPAAGYWDRFVSAPRLSSGSVNTVRLRSLTERHPEASGERSTSWGQRLMHLDRSAGRFSGSGVRIGIIDSGCDNTHPALRHIKHGKSFIEGASDSHWTDDFAAQGTHCAGIIAAESTGHGIGGFAPDAEVHVLKTLPGGRNGELLAALHECIERELDVVSISVGSYVLSELVAQKLMEARQRGVACIVAAGNSGGPVAFPAMLPSVMAVGAVGKLGEFPPDSCHGQAVIPQLIGRDGVFAAGFSCAGPQIAVCAPGVAVVSTVPGGGFAAADGTSAAAAHVTGFAALVLAHHPLFQEGPFRTRSEARVQALFELIRASAMPYFADSHRGGAGVPDLHRLGEQELAIGLPAGRRLGPLAAYGSMLAPAVYARR